jgi:hypothetical protein
LSTRPLRRPQEASAACFFVATSPPATGSSPARPAGSARPLLPGSRSTAGSWH